jgi:hypothetical protein
MFGPQHLTNDKYDKNTEDLGAPSEHGRGEISVIASRVVLCCVDDLSYDAGPCNIDLPIPIPFSDVGFCHIPSAHRDIAVIVPSPYGI